MEYRDELLLLIEERSVGGLFFVPSYDGSNWCNRLGRYILVAGSGAASCLRALERKGFIRFEPRIGRYACQITEEGRLYAQTLA